MGQRVGWAALVGLCVSSAWAQVPAGGEFRVNSYTTSTQWMCDAALSATGGFIVTWDSYGQDGSRYGIFGQAYEASGSPRGSEFRVNTFAASYQENSSAAADAAGNFVVVWQSDLWDSSSYGVFAQRYDSSGTRRGGEFRVNATTYGIQWNPAVASADTGGFVVVWESDSGGGWDVFGQRYDRSGAPLNGEFRVNSYTTGSQRSPVVASDGVGNLVVAWHSEAQGADAAGVFAQRFAASGQPLGTEFRVSAPTAVAGGASVAAAAATGQIVIAWQAADGDGAGVFARRYDSNGLPLGPEFRVTAYTTGYQGSADVDADAAGNFIVTWGDSRHPVFRGRRYDASGSPRGDEFVIDSYTTGVRTAQAIGSDAVGNIVVAWGSLGQDGSSWGILAQRFGGLQPAALSVDAVASSGSDGNRVLEPAETAVVVAPSWRNVNGATQAFGGTALGFDGPVAGGVSYTLADAAGAYGSVANGATAACSDCYAVGVGFGGARPSTHWDATLVERLAPDEQGQTKLWAVHLGDSFVDVPRTNGFYRFVETLLHKGVTGGCSATTYCPGDPVTREQVAVFTLAAKEGAGYAPPACGTPVFGDVPASSPFCRFVEELARRGVVAGCGGGNFCPGNPVTREQMPVFVLKTLDPALDPPACGTPMFGDVPASSPFCRFVEELARRGVVSGCGGGNYCPSDPVSREQMAVFIAATFGLSLYGP